ncbi:MAG TPA: PilZ domain-containing protein [Syntrophales bacterium]|nr:PilZ domain-containing protein [Syntrophales bacterium]
MDYRSDKREYARVAAYLPLDVRLVPPEERDIYRPRISGVAALDNFTKPPELDDKPLAQWLNMLNAKLDSIISALSVEREGFGSLTYRALNISAAGMGFKSKEKYDKGVFLEMKILLYMYPHVALYLYGDVIKSSERDGDDFFTSIKFVGLTDDIRDEIIKFVFRRQREILSAKRG